MPKKLIALLLIFFAILIGLFAINFSYIKTPDFKPFSTNSASLTNPLSTSLSLSPNPLPLSGSQSASVNISMKRGISNKSPILVQVELGYDPSSIFITRITPGDFLTNPEIVLNNIDYNTGRISYALKGNISPESQSTVLATIYFTAPNYSFKKDTEINFLPKTLVRSGEDNVKIESMNGSKITFPLVYFTKPASPAAIIR